jgi:uncharacterized protein (DUF58 family)
MAENKITPAAFDDPRWILIRASKIGIALTMAAGVMSAIIIIASPLAWWTIAALMFALIVLLALEVSRLTLRRPASVVAFYLVDLDYENAVQKNNLGIRLRHRDGRNSEGRVRTGAFVMPWFMNIPYDDSGQTSRYRKVWPRVLPLWRDALSADDARRTRVKLRWK